MCITWGKGKNFAEVGVLFSRTQIPCVWLARSSRQLYIHVWQCYFDIPKLEQQNPLLSLQGDINKLQTLANKMQILYISHKHAKWSTWALITISNYTTSAQCPTATPTSNWRDGPWSHSWRTEISQIYPGTGKQGQQGFEAIQALDKSAFLYP